MELDECSDLNFKEPPTLPLAAMARTVPSMGSELVLSYKDSLKKCAVE